MAPSHGGCPGSPAFSPTATEEKGAPGGMPGGGGNTQPAGQEAGVALESRGWRAPTCWTCRAGQRRGGTGSGAGPHLPFEAAAQAGLELRIDC